VHADPRLYMGRNSQAKLTDRSLKAIGGLSTKGNKPVSRGTNVL
jgi:hypothetical protein